jgi:hypothetical protein
MTNVFFDAPFTDDLRREHLFKGDLFAFSPRPSTVALAQFAQQMIEEAFAPRHPQYAQFELGPEELAAILGNLKPRFTNHPRAKELLQGILREFGCELSETYFDVPKMRSMTSGDHLKAGIALAFDLHRDSWFASPLCQQNWWLPIYEIGPDDALAFHSRYWSEPVRNGSGGYNQYEWNQTGRKMAAQYVKSDTRKVPHPEQPVELDPQIRLITRPGGVIIFSGAQMHSTVPNTAGRTRFSIDFRIVHVDDVRAKRGAPNLDSAATGTTLWELMRGDDFSRLDEATIRLYDPNPPESGRVFEPEPVATPRS